MIFKYLLTHYFLTDKLPRFPHHDYLTGYISDNLISELQQVLGRSHNRQFSCDLQLCLLYQIFQLCEGWPGLRVLFPAVTHHLRVFKIFFSLFRILLTLLYRQFGHSSVCGSLTPSSSFASQSCHEVIIINVTQNHRTPTL